MRKNIVKQIVSGLTAARMAHKPVSISTKSVYEYGSSGRSMRIRIGRKNSRIR
jgi:hypothetical protein